MALMADTSPHIPVMLDEVLAALGPKDAETYVDGTFGAGGYTRAILDTASCDVIAIDRDQSAHTLAEPWKANYGDRLRLIHGAFSDIRGHLDKLGLDKVDAVILDLGVSSMQLDQAERGFSFRFDAPLDMRMDQSRGETAADVVNTMPEKELADMIYLYGEERHSRRIAAGIAKARLEKKIETTRQLTDIIRSVVHFSHKDKIDPSTRTFQALRIHVNDELGELERILASSEDILADGGRLVIVTFHSLEDRIVKSFLNDRAKPQSSPSRYLPDLPQKNSQTFTLLNRKALAASEAEISRNPRSRSAKLRAAIRRAA
jgi:16S rRNA (cytosine1402-N4)-methyltransferase